MSPPAVPLPGRLDRIKVLAAESIRINGQLLAAALAQDRQLELIGVESKLPSILAAVAQQRPHVVLISSAFEKSGTQSFDSARQISAAGKGTRVIFLMDTSSPAHVVQAFRCGAMEFPPVRNPRKVSPSAFIAFIRARSGQIVRSSLK
jgi:DNA-binding NarL/FixJ family response regulator